MNKQQAIEHLAAHERRKTDFEAQQQRKVAEREDLIRLIGESVVERLQAEVLPQLELTAECLRFHGFHAVASFSVARGAVSGGWTIIASLQFVSGESRDHSNFQSIGFRGEVMGDHWRVRTYSPMKSNVPPREQIFNPAGAITLSAFTHQCLDQLLTEAFPR